MNYKILQGDSLEVLKTLEPESVNCCITSPPYWGLRDYGMGKAQIGLELTPQEYVEKMVAVFAEVKRVLRKDGTLWLNLGDSYSSGNRKTTTPQTIRGTDNAEAVIATNARPPVVEGIKQKDLIGIPWRVAFALQESGWYLRQDIIWHKPNPMPESVTDRCTKAHEYIFLLSKSAIYYFDSDAMQEETGRTGGNPRIFGAKNQEGTKRNDIGEDFIDNGKRNKRSVWSVTVKPYSEAHFATFPKELIEPCVLAGCPEGGTILDPFGGSGTTAEVALENRRNAILIELNPKYIEIAERRIRGMQPKLFVV